MTRVSALSGGERNRVILAKLFTLPSNVLVLDEPTNDLDVETLEALEARLTAYAGTLLVVSHDRHFLDRVVTSTLVFEGDGAVKRYAGGYSDWARLQHSLATTDVPDESSQKASKTTVEAEGVKPASRKLSYKLQRELDALPNSIDALENEIASLERAVNDPSLYERSRDEINTRFAELESLRKDLERKVERWEELESARQSALEPR